MQRKDVVAFATALALGALAVPSQATVYFQNTGNKEGFPNYPQKPQARGTIDTVTSPTYKGSTSIRFTQTWIGDTGYAARYHSEVMVGNDYPNAQRSNQDRYYGLAVFLPSNWVYAGDNICFQQWAGNGPWLMMEVRGSNIIVLPHGSMQNLGTMPRGVWVRVVSRLRTSTSGVFQAWVNGTRKMSVSANYVIPGAPTLRWSAGLYVTGWFPRKSTPPNPRVRLLYQDHYRIASTLAEAEPANW